MHTYPEKAQGIVAVLTTVALVKRLRLTGVLSDADVSTIVADVEGAVTAMGAMAIREHVDRMILDLKKELA